MDPALVDALYATLTTMHENPQGAAALETLDETAKFDAFPGGGDATFERIWSMLDMLEASSEPSS